MIIAVIGAGNMGSGIAQKYATENHEVILYDNASQGLARGKQKIEDTLTEAVTKGVFAPEKADAIRTRLRFTTELADLAEADLVIEAVFEDLAVKKALFAELDTQCSAKTIFATNTSSFRVEDLATSTTRQDRFVGLHYFYHPAKNRLVEVIRGPHASDATFDRVYQLQEAIGKIPIVSADAPGFVVNRFFVPWLNEAMRLVDEKMTNIATVDWAAKRAFHIGMGPFELMNVTGVPITLHAATTLFDAFGEFYRPCPLIGPVVQKGAHWELDGPVDITAYEIVRDRLMKAVFSVAKQMVLTEKVCSIEDCDLGARVGLRWKYGPFELMAMAGEARLRPKKITTSIQNGVALICLDRPDALNALDQQTLVDLEEALNRFEHDTTVKGVVLQGRGRSFAAGADTQFFVDHLTKDEVQPILDFAAFGQQVLRKIELFPKPVVALIHGMTLGGGLELALACDYIIAKPGTRLGFPETGIGIYPGLGGTQRSVRRVGKALARWLILSGELISAEQALTVGLVDSAEGQDALSLAIAWAQTKTPASETFRARDDARDMNALERFFEKPLSELMQSKNSSLDVDVQKALKKIAHKAPVALQMAEELIASAEDLTLEQGLRRETEGLSRVFNTKDALIGISSIGKERPVFSGY